MSLQRQRHDERDHRHQHVARQPSHNGPKRRRPQHTGQQHRNQTDQEPALVKEGKHRADSDDRGIRQGIADNIRRFNPQSEIRNPKSFAFPGF
jgi:hypothetical protein